MHKIEDTFMEKEMSTKTNDPYGLSIDVLETVGGYGKIKENKNDYLVSGPKKQSVVDFRYKERLDNKTFLLIDFCLKGEKRANSADLDIYIKATIQAKIETGKGPLVTAFSKHYISDVFPRLSKEGKKKAKKIISSAMNIISSS